MENIVTKIVFKVGADKVMHLLACALIGALATAYLHSVVLGAIAAVVVGVLKEVYDVATGGQLDLGDIAADVVGAMLGSVLICGAL